MPSAHSDPRRHAQLVATRDGSPKLTTRHFRFVLLVKPHVGRNAEKGSQPVMPSQHTTATRHNARIVHAGRSEPCPGVRRHPALHPAVPPSSPVAAAASGIATGGRHGPSARRRASTAPQPGGGSASTSSLRIPCAATAPPPDARPPRRRSTMSCRSPEAARPSTRPTAARSASAATPGAPPRAGSDGGGGIETLEVSRPPTGGPWHACGARLGQGGGSR